MWPYSVLPYGLGMPQQSYGYGQGYGMPQQNPYQPVFQWWQMQPQQKPSDQQNESQNQDQQNTNLVKKPTSQQAKGGLGMMQVGLQMLAPRPGGQPNFPFPYR